MFFIYTREYSLLQNFQKYFFFSFIIYLNFIKCFFIAPWIFILFNHFICRHVRKFVKNLIINEQMYNWNSMSYNNWWYFSCASAIVKLLGKIKRARFVTTGFIRLTSVVQSNTKFTALTHYTKIKLPVTLFRFVS